MTSCLEATVYFGGPIHTLLPGDPLAEAIGVVGDSIAAVGPRRDVEAALVTEGGCRPRPVDLDGAALYPGFVDSHVHLSWLGERMGEVELEGVGSLERALEMVRAFADGLAPGEWVRGGGWNKNLWRDGRFPSRGDLNRVAPRNPVALNSKDGHSWWLNSEALRLTGISRDTPDPAGGEIERDPSGEATGILKEKAGTLVEAALAQPSPQELAARLRKAVGAAHAKGLTGIQDVEGPDSFRGFQSLDKTGELTLRVWFYVPADQLSNLEAVGVEGGFGGRYVRLAGLKAFLDGALGSQTAHLLGTYEASSNRGLEILPFQAFSDLVARASSAGLAIAVHAIGDAANRKALDAFDAHRAAWQAAGLRQRIEHVQLLDLADVPRLGRLGIVASMQPLHAPSDRDIADRHWGPRRLAGAYAWRSILGTGAVLAFGSDAPVETLDPLQGVFAAVTRRHPREPEREAWHPEQTVSALEAVRAYTVGPAYAVKAERERGTLEPGKIADFTILSDDILACPPQTILRTRVVATVVGGCHVYGSLDGR